MKHLIIGNGEIGSSLAKVLKCDICDIEGVEGKYDVLHICFPYFDGFVDAVKGYKEKHEPELTIIHATVPVGTSDECGACHSPVRGVHPHLSESILTFVKFVGGKDSIKARNLFRKYGIHSVAVDSARDTEAGKLWSTTGYGLNIILEKYIHKYCEENDLDFDVVYTMFNTTYNKGYRDMKMQHFQKYNLKHMDGKIGGHCIEPNCELLGGDIAQFILDCNNKL